MTKMHLCERINLHLKVSAGTFNITREELGSVYHALKNAEEINDLRNTLILEIKRATKTAEVTYAINIEAEEKADRLNKARHRLRQFALISFGSYWAYSIIIKITGG